MVAPPPIYRLPPRRVVPTPQAKAAQRGTVRREGDRFVLDGVYDTDFAEAIRTWRKPRPEPRFDPADKTRVTWLVGTNLGEVLSLIQFVTKFRWEWDHDAQQMANDVLARAEQNRAASKLEEAHFTVEGLGGTLRPYQTAAVAFALRQAGRRVPDDGEVLRPEPLQEGEKVSLLCADSCGLGKTQVGMATLHAFSAFPAVVVTRALNVEDWVRHIEGHEKTGIPAWLPGRTVQALRPGRKSIDRADVYVVSYSSLAKWSSELRAMKLRGIVFDEGHELRSGRRVEKAKAALWLCEGDIPVRVVLTANPVVNDPDDLVPQLEVLGVLSKFGGAAGFHDLFHWGNKQRNLRILSAELRSAIMVRRRKVDVIKELPPIVRPIITVPISDQSNREEYDAAEKDVVAWLLSHGEDATGAMRNERLVRLNKLRHLVELGKVDATARHIESLLEKDALREPGERPQKVLVFAFYLDVLAELKKRFPDALVIVGGKEKENRAAADSFQTDPSKMLLIAQLMTGGTSVTLTAAMNIVTQSLWWNPTTHWEQAEGRAHRVNDLHGLTSYYILGEDSIDETLWNVLMEKALTASLIHDGVSVGPEIEERTTSGVQDEVVKRLLARTTATRRGA